MSMKDEFWVRSGPLKSRKRLTGAELKRLGLCVQCRRANRGSDSCYCAGCKAKVADARARPKTRQLGGKTRSFAQFEREKP